METCKKCRNYGSNNPCCCCDGVNGFDEKKEESATDIARRHILYEISVCQLKLGGALEQVAEQQEYIKDACKRLAEL